MIPSSFYPSDVVLVNQNMDLTRYIMDIPITSAEFSSAYWLGWINFDNLPTSYHLSSYTYDNGICDFTDVTAQNNYPVGYTCYYDTETNMIRTKTLADTNNGTKWQDATACWGNWNASKFARLPNDLDVNTTSYKGYAINIGIRGTADNGTYVDSIWGFFVATSPLLTGTFTVTMHRYLGNFYSDTQLTLDYDDFENGIFEFTENGITYKLVICTWECLYERDINTDNSVSNYANTKPTILVSDTYGQQHLLGVMTAPYMTELSFSWYTSQGHFGNGFFLWSDGHVTDPYNGGCFYNKNGDNYVVYGGLVGSFDLANNPINTPLIYFPEGANFIVVGEYRSDFAIINRIYAIDDIRKTLALVTRYTMVTSQQYVNSSDYLYAHVSEENEFLCELIDGTHTEPEGLRDWQIVGNTIIDNDFDPEDIPPYEPEPVDDGPDSGGDGSRPWDFVNTPLSATNNFVTLYALSTAQVSEFGSVMWAKLSDTAFWQSVGTVFLNDFSINPADMLKYFVSLRYFPFDLSNYSATYANGIYIGRSTYPIQISTYPRRMARNLVEISGGSAQVILPPPYNTQDFRNCDPNTQVSVYVPYCGIVELSAAEVYGKYLDLRYYADMQTGALAASVCVRSDTYYEIATLAGSCGAEVPITANNNAEFLQRIATVASSGLGGTISGATNGAQIGGTPGAVAGGALGALTGTAQAMLALPPVSVHKSGKATGYATLGCDNQAHITIQISKPAVPDSFAHTNGYISNKQARIGDLTGYTEMINPDTSGIDAHADELEKIKAILQTGFYA